jgi:hypothetical protein
MFIKLTHRVLMVTYLFDMDYRRVNALLWLHHTVTLAACLFYVHITNPDAPEVGRAWLSLPMTFFGLGVGAVDIAGDAAVLLYYITPQPQWLAAARAIRACAWYLVLGRAVGWSIVLRILLRGDWQLLELGTGAKVGFSLMLSVWGTAEVEECFAILGISEKLRLRALAEAKGTAKEGKMYQRED